MELFKALGHFGIKLLSVPARSGLCPECLSSRAKLQRYRAFLRPFIGLSSLGAWSILIGLFPVGHSKHEEGAPFLARGTSGVISLRLTSEKSFTIHAVPPQGYSLK
jgi:hypothetical protein